MSNEENDAGTPLTEAERREFILNLHKESEKFYTPERCELLRNTVALQNIPQSAPKYRKVRDEDFTGEDRERIYKKLHTPYGL